MAYPAPFHRIVMIGSLFADTFNVTLSMVPGLSGTVPAVTDALATDVGEAIAGWWPLTTIATPNGIGLSSAAKLTSVKVNRIGTDGRYMDPEPREYTLPSPLGGPSTAQVTPQLTIVASLRGVNERARAGKGRMYFPPSEFCQGVLGADGRIPITNATIYAQGVQHLLGILNDVYFAAGVNALAGIASKTSAGAFQDVETVTVGRVVDTMRSRRSKLPEDPVVVSM